MKSGHPRWDALTLVLLNVCGLYLHHWLSVLNDREIEAIAQAHVAKEYPSGCEILYHLN